MQKFVNVFNIKAFKRYFIFCSETFRKESRYFYLLIFLLNTIFRIITFGHRPSAALFLSADSTDLYVSQIHE